MELHPEIERAAGKLYRDGHYTNAIEDAVKAGSWLCGPPEFVAERLMEVQEHYPGLDEVNMGNAVGTPEKVILEQLEWFGKEVMPKFKSQVAEPVVADD